MTLESDLQRWRTAGATLVGRWGESGDIQQGLVSVKNLRILATCCFWQHHGQREGSTFFCLIGNNEGIWICSRQPWQRIWSACHHVELMFFFVCFFVLECFKYCTKFKIYKWSVREVIVRHWLPLHPMKSNLEMKKQNSSESEQKHHTRFHNCDFNMLFNELTLEKLDNKWDSLTWSPVLLHLAQV